jgi:hypothetical protein
VHPSNEPILILLVLRLAGRFGLFPPILTSFPYEERLRYICVNGRRWEDIPSPKVDKNINIGLQWFPEGFHKPPAPTELYNQLLMDIRDIRDSDKSVEEVGHNLLIKNGYEKKDGDDFYSKKCEKNQCVVKLLRKKAFVRYNEWCNEWPTEWPKGSCKINGKINVEEM